MNLPPRLQSAWDRGRKAGENDAPPSANPYRPETDAELYQTWECARSEADPAYRLAGKKPESLTDAPSEEC